MSRCNLPAALSAEWPGSFTCHCGNTGVERTLNKSQLARLTLEKKTLPPLPSGFELATFRWRVRRSNRQAIPVPDVSRDSICCLGCYVGLIVASHQRCRTVSRLGGSGSHSRQRLLASQWQLFPQFVTWRSADVCGAAKLCFAQSANVRLVGTTSLLRKQEW